MPAEFERTLRLWTVHLINKLEIVLATPAHCGHCDDCCLIDCHFSIGLQTSAPIPVNHDIFGCQASVVLLSLDFLHAQQYLDISARSGIDQQSTAPLNSIVDIDEVK
jgi:hypothetical protein